MTDNATANIISLNVNQFCKKGNWKTSTPDYTCIDDIVDYISTKLTNRNDVAFLYEIPYCNYKEVFNSLELTLKNHNLNLIRPQQLFNRRPQHLTCAITTSTLGSNWKLETENYSFKFSEYINYGKSTPLSYNRVVDLYNEIHNIHLLGIHIAASNYTPESSVVWDDLFYYYKNIKNAKVFIVGDLNVFEKNTIQDRKFKELKNIGIYDIWLTKDKPHKHKTYEHNDSRLDYALSSPSAYDLVSNININDDIRADNKSDHSAIELTFKLLL